MQTFLPFWFIVSFVSLATFGDCQKPFIRGTIEVFDKYEMKLKRIGGNIETFRMSLLRNIDQTEKDTTVGVNFEIETVKKSDLITSTGFTMTSNLDFAVSTSTVKKIDHQKGTMLLTFEEFLSLIDFFNETIAKKSQEPEYDTGWQLEIEERFALALLFERQPGPSGQKWKYYLRLDDAEFEVTFDNAIEMFKKMAAFKKRIKEGMK